MYKSSNIAERIKSVAKKRNVKINLMLDDCGLSKNTLSSMLSGGSMPKSENLAKIADYLDCSVDYLLGRDAERKKSPSLDGLEDEAEKQLIQFFRSLNETGCEKMLDYAADLADTGKYKKITNVQKKHKPF